MENTKNTKPNQIENKPPESGAIQQVKESVTFMMKFNYRVEQYFDELMNTWEIMHVFTGEFRFSPDSELLQVNYIESDFTLKGKLSFDFKAYKEHVYVNLSTLLLKEAFKRYPWYTQRGVIEIS